MNINRALIVLFAILIVIVVLTVFRFNQTKSTRIEHIYIDDEALIANIICIPDIVRSYGNVKDVYGEKNILFFRYAHNSCSSCIFNYLEEILALQKEIGKEHIWIFPAYPNDRGSRIQLNAELSKFNYHNIPADSLLIPIINGKQKQYFGWLNNEREIELIFIPDINNSLYTNKFFLEVKRILNM